MLPYTRERIRADLIAIGARNMGLGDAGPGAIRPDLMAGSATMAYGGADAEFEELLEYCWRSYDKTFRDHGNQIIGRVNDLGAKRTDLMALVAGITDTTTQTLLTAGTFGNVQNLDKWVPVVNDCWLLGGVHRRAIFQLVSPTLPKNLWTGSRLVVTAREILGLLNFGYVAERAGMFKLFRPADANKAQLANIRDYDRLTKGASPADVAQFGQLFNQPLMPAHR